MTSHSQFQGQRHDLATEPRWQALRTWLTSAWKWLKDFGPDCEFYDVGHGHGCRCAHCEECRVDWSIW